MSATLNQYPRRDALYTIQADGVTAQNRYDDRFILLDPLASELWLRADGLTTLGAIARDIAGVSGVSVRAMEQTIAILAVILNSEGILYPRLEPAPLPYHLSMPREDQDAERMHQSMAATGWLDHRSD